MEAPLGEYELVAKFFSNLPTAQYRRDYERLLRFQSAFAGEGLEDHDFTMELFVHDGSNMMGGSGCIEWDVPSMDETVHIGFWWRGKKLVDYDGVFDLPKEAIKLLENFGLDCNEFK